MTPCIVITRDRVTHLRQCLANLNDGHYLDLHIVDHGSTWPPMVDYLLQLQRVRAVPVHHRGDHPPRELWDWDGLAHIVGRRRYLVTDPDLELDPDCPHDWLDALGEELDRGGLAKVGLSLRTDDLPDTALAEKVRAWERPFSTDLRPSGKAWRGPVDTTLALYLPLSVHPEFKLVPGARLTAPYQVRHLPWYETGEPSLEETYYREHLIPGSSHWAGGGW